MTDDTAARLRALAERTDDARNFPANTCPASRHVQMIADDLLAGHAHAVEDREHCAESLYVTVEALWKVRTEIDALRRERDAVLAANRDAMLHFDVAKSERDAAMALLREAREQLVSQCEVGWYRSAEPDGAMTHPLADRIDALLGDGGEAERG